MLSYENDAIKLSKTAEKYKQHVHHVNHSSGARETGIFLQTSLPLTRNMNAKIPSSCIMFLPKSEILILVTFH